MARKPKVATRRRTSSTPASHVKQTLTTSFLLLIGGLAVVPHPTVVIVIGMLPTMVAYAVTGGIARGPRCFTIAAFNAAGVLPIAIDLMFAQGNAATAGSVLINIYAWLVMYSAAAAGVLVNWLAPHIAAQVLNQMARREVDKLRDTRKSLIAEWSEEVAAPDPRPSPGDAKAAPGATKPASAGASIKPASAGGAPAP